MDSLVFSIIGNPNDGVQVMKTNNNGQLVKTNSKKKERPKK